MNRPAPNWPLFHPYCEWPTFAWAEVRPRAFSSPQLFWLNPTLMQELGWTDWLEGMEDSALMAQVFSGQLLPSAAKPIALAYAGHQFGQFAVLGDGRACLMGTTHNRQGMAHDIQFKGSGPTPYSRRGDGLAALGPMVRECIVSEAFHALGIPTTRTLAVVRTGESVYRQHRETGAVLTRVAQSHLRVGTFEYFAYSGDRSALQGLIEWTINRHFPHLARETIGGAEKIWALFRTIAHRQAALIAAWRHVGFIHGVMNTDNMSIVGETIDFGPCAFLDHYQPQAVFSSIDHNGRYAYNQQGRIGEWNLARLAECFLPLIIKNPDDENERIEAINTAQEELSHYRLALEQEERDGAWRKLGLLNREEGDRALLEDWHTLMDKEKLDFTNAHRHLLDDFRALMAQPQDSVAPPPLMPSAFNLSAVSSSPEFMAWRMRWHKRILRQSLSADKIDDTLRLSNPCIIPRNHQIEKVIRAAEDDNSEPFRQLMSALAKPYDNVALGVWPEDYRAPPTEDERVRETFCGT